MTDIIPCRFCNRVPYIHECEEMSDQKGELEVICLYSDCPIKGIGIALTAWQTRAASPSDPKDNAVRLSKGFYDSLVERAQQVVCECDDCEKWRNEHKVNASPSEWQKGIPPVFTAGVSGPLNFHINDGNGGQLCFGYFNHKRNLFMGLEDNYEISPDKVNYYCLIPKLPPPPNNHNREGA